MFVFTMCAGVLSALWRDVYTERVDRHMQPRSSTNEDWRLGVGDSEPLRGTCRFSGGFRGGHVWNPGGARGRLISKKARQTRFIVPHQLLSRFACGCAIIITSICYTHPANLWHYGHKKWACHCLEGDNDSWGGRSQRKRALMRNNKSSLPGLIVYLA